MSKVESFASSLRLISEQHEHFMADMVGSSFKALLAENQRLTEDVTTLHEQLRKARSNNHMSALECSTMPGCSIKSCDLETQLAGLDESEEMTNAHHRGQPNAHHFAQPPLPGMPHFDPRGGLPGNGRKMQAIAPRRQASPAVPPRGLTPSLPGQVPSRMIEAVPAKPTSGSRRAQLELSNLQKEVKDKLRTKESDRLREVFPDIEEHDDYINVRVLHDVLLLRKVNFEREQLAQVLSEFQNLVDDGLVECLDIRKVSKHSVQSERGRLPRLSLASSGSQAHARLPFGAMVDICMLPSSAIETMSTDAQGVIEVLNSPTLDEVVTEATRHNDPRKLAHPDEDAFRWEKLQNRLLMVVVCVNVSAMGISIDREPEHLGWLVFEATCVAIFAVDVAIKVWFYGNREYFRGRHWRWNALDFLTTLIAFAELGVAVAVRVSAESDPMVARVKRMATILRVLRLTRFLRLFKLVQSAALADLANMLAGFYIGLPTMVWVIGIFICILYMVGLAFRICFGPSIGREFISICGYGDWIDPRFEESEGCKLADVYGEEFFGTVAKSMFTTFRFMLGDYSTKGGKSLAIAFSDGYGAQFQVLFVIGMIIVIFGFFNIITAVFVETTISGLKTNETKRKYARRYEQKFVKDKLKNLLERVQGLWEEKTSKHTAVFNRSKSALPPDMLTKRGGMIDADMSAYEFRSVMRDEAVKDILNDLDVGIRDPGGLFDTFDADGTGKVSIQELATGLMRIRGEPHKTDIIASWVAIRALHEKFDQLQYLILAQKQVQQIEWNSTEALSPT